MSSFVRIFQLFISVCLFFLLVYLETGSFGVSTSMTTFAAIANHTRVPLLHAEQCDHSTESNVSSNISVTSTEEAPEYIFTTSSPLWRAKIEKDAPVPACLHFQLQNDGSVLVQDNKNNNNNNADVALQFYLGPAGSGAPVHFHGHAANTLAYGEKVCDCFLSACLFLVLTFVY